MIILDTNTLYYAAKIEPNNDIKLEMLLNYIKTNKCLCTRYSVFEILNSKFSFKEKLKVLDFIKNYNITLGSTDNINKEVLNNLNPNNKDENYYNSLKKIYGNHIIDEMAYNISFFVICYAYASITIIIDNYQKELNEAKLYFREHFMLYQKAIDLHIKKIITKKFKELLSDNNFNAETVQNVLLTIIANVMTYYYELMRNSKILFEGGNKNSYYKLIKIYKKLKNKMLKDDLLQNIPYEREYLSICKTIIDYFATSNEYPELKISRVKNYLKNKIVDSIYFVDPNMKNEFEEVFLTRLINSLMVESAKMKPNDFIDYEILREFYYNEDNIVLVTFDKNMKNIMTQAAGIKKFSDSIQLINSFKKNWHLLTPMGAVFDSFITNRADSWAINYLSFFDT